MGQGQVAQRLENASKTKVLVLQNLNLKRFPEEKRLGALTGLKALDCSNNEIEVVPPTALAILSPSLKTLNLSHNAMKEVRVGTVDMPALEQCDLSNNSIVALPQWPRPWPALRSLQLSGNALRSLGDSVLGSFPALRVLDLSHNALSTLPSTLFSLPQLQELNLSHNRIIVFGPTGSAYGGPRKVALPCLQILRLSHNQLRDIAPAVFTETPLNVLELEGNPLTLTELKQRPEYDVWAERQKDSINKQLQGGLVVRLNS
eukprot:RCo052027